MTQAVLIMHLSCRPVRQDDDGYLRRTISPSNPLLVLKRRAL